MYAHRHTDTHTDSNTLQEGERRQVELRNHFVLPPYPCWPLPGAGRQGLVGQYWGHGHLWNSAGRTGQQAEPPGVSPQIICSEPPTCKSQSALPKKRTKHKVDIRLLLPSINSSDFQDCYVIIK